MSKVKLTKPQIEVLRALAIRTSHLGASYPPVKKLTEFGFIAEKQGRWSSSYEITDLGRSALAEEGGGR